jgi:glyoxylase-like metal-dependent hydrolase (beta-lactamase superfamily II)
VKVRNPKGDGVLIAGFPAGSWATNCYVIATGPGEPCLVIDPGQDSIEGVHDVIREHRLLPAAVMLTHGHIDHIWSVAPITAEFDIPALIHPDDRYRLADPAGSSFMAAREQLLAMTRNSLELTEPQEVRLFEDDATLELAGLALAVRHAPGHTEGSVVFQLPGVMFSGDVLFAGSIGRTDLPGGDHAQMIDSLRRVILPADDELVVLPGHGPQTTIADEKAANPYLLPLVSDETGRDAVSPNPRGL